MIKIEGYALLFNVRDCGRDVVLPGACKGPERKRPMLFEHDPGTVCGRWEIIRQDQRGLFCSGLVELDWVEQLINSGALDGLSIGFRVTRGFRCRESGVRYIEQLDLWEISLVSFPMQQVRFRIVEAMERRVG